MSLSHTNSLRFSDQTGDATLFNANSFNIFTASPNDSMGSTLGTDVHYFDFIVHQTGNDGTVSDYTPTTGGAEDGKLDAATVKKAVTAMGMILRSQLNKNATNFSKINRLIITCDMKT